MVYSKNLCRVCHEQAIFRPIRGFPSDSVLKLQDLGKSAYIYLPTVELSYSCACDWDWFQYLLSKLLYAVQPEVYPFGQSQLSANRKLEICAGGRMCQRAQQMKIVVFCQAGFRRWSCCSRVRQEYRNAKLRSSHKSWCL